MSGHSKWSTIKHKKALTDAKKAKIFSKLSAQISLAAKSGGDPSMNPNLRLAIDSAKHAEMPKDNIERAINRGSGVGGASQLQELTYEVYGPGGAAILVKAVSDNINRITGEIRAVLNKLGGKLGSTGSVNYLFEQKGIICLKPTDECYSEMVELKLMELEIDDLRADDQEIFVYTSKNNIEKVSSQIKQIPEVIYISSEVVYEPKNSISLDQELTDKVTRLLDALDEIEDVVEISSNLEV